MICVHDNPATMSRECWQDGKLICALSAEMFFVREHISSPVVFMGVNLLGEWEEGQYFGDLKAKGEDHE